jgi:hypothetical protein
MLETPIKELVKKLSSLFIFIPDVKMIPIEPERHDEKMSIGKILATLF